MNLLDMTVREVFAFMGQAGAGFTSLALKNAAEEPLMVVAFAHGKEDAAKLQVICDEQEQDETAIVKTGTDKLGP